LKKLTNRKTKKNKRKTKRRKKKLQRGGGLPALKEYIKNEIKAGRETARQLTAGLRVAALQDNIREGISKYSVSDESEEEKLHAFNGLSSSKFEWFNGALLEIPLDQGNDLSSLYTGFQTLDILKQRMKDFALSLAPEQARVAAGGEAAEPVVAAEEEAARVAAAAEEAERLAAEEARLAAEAEAVAAADAARVAADAAAAEQARVAADAAAADAARVAEALLPIAEEPEEEEEPEPEEEEEPQPAPAAGQIPGTNWERVYSDTGDLYYLNTSTNETQWYTPQEVVDAEEGEEEEEEETQEETQRRLAQMREGLQAAKAAKAAKAARLAEEARLVEEQARLVEEQAATKIQATYKATQAAKAAKAAAEEAAAATKIQATYRGHNDPNRRARADIDGFLEELASQVNQGPELPVASNMCTVLQGQQNKVLEQIKLKDEEIVRLHDQIAGASAGAGAGAGAGTAQLQQRLKETELERDEYRRLMNELEARLIELKKELYCSILTKVRIAKMSDGRPLNTTFPTKNSLPAPRGIIAEVIGDTAASVDALDAVWGSGHFSLTYEILLSAILAVGHLLREKGWNLLSEHDVEEVLLAEEIDVNFARGVNQEAMYTLLNQIIAFIEGGNALVPGSFVDGGVGQEAQQPVLGASVDGGELQEAQQPVLGASAEKEGGQPSPAAKQSSKNESLVRKGATAPPPSGKADAVLPSQIERREPGKLPKSRIQVLEDLEGRFKLEGPAGRVSNRTPIGPGISITFDSVPFGFSFMRGGYEDPTQQKKFQPEISSVLENGPAANKGVKVGFLIKSVNGKETRSGGEGEGVSGLSSDDMVSSMTSDSPTTIVFDVPLDPVSGPTGKLSPLGQPGSTSAASDRGAQVAEEIGQRENSPKALSDLAAAQKSANRRKEKQKEKADAAEARARKAKEEGAENVDELNLEATRLRELANSPVDDVSVSHDSHGIKRGGGMSRKHLKRKKTKRKKTKRKKTKRKKTKRK